MSRNPFTWCAALLLTALLGLAVLDNHRPWRRIQAGFLERELTQVEERLWAARQRAAAAAEELGAELEQERLELAEHEEVARRLEAELRGLRGKRRQAELLWHAARARLEEAAYRQRPGEAPDDAPALAEEARRRRIEVESLDELVAAREREREVLLAGVSSVEQRLSESSSEAEWQQHRAAELRRGRWLGRWPLGELLDPRLEVREVTLGDLPRRLPTGEAERRDRCATCHLGAVRDDLAADTWPAPYQPHPRLELFVGASSPHPVQRYGCTVCHGGEGRATDFTRAGHRPSSAEQAADWRARWGWRGEEAVPVPILPPALGEAGCVPCHGGEVWIPEAPIAGAGRRLVRTLGCAACHELPALGEVPRTGPSLRHLAVKSRPGWVWRRLASPGELGAGRMPHTFDAADVPSERSRRRRAAQARALVSFLWQVSEPLDLPAAPAGDAAAGEALFAAVGCAGCHLLGDDPTGLAPGSQRRWGPDLAHLGSRAEPAWLYAWLRDPRSLHGGAAMPDLRLSDGEAADLTAFLGTLRDPAWDGREPPPIDAAARDELLLAHLARGATLEASQARLEAMDAHQREVALGEHTAVRYGCAGCHDIPGLERPAPAAGTLDGRRLWGGLERFAGRFHHPPRRGGSDALGPPPMPAYRLEPGERRAVLTQLLGWTAPAVPAARQAGGGTHGAALAAGRRLLERHGCRACHRIEGEGGALAATLASPRQAPPELETTGARLQASWLFAYLHDPGELTLRPWSPVRMPGYGLSDADAETLVAYFAARAGRGFLASAPPPPDAAGVTAGEVLFGVLQCGRCHPDTADAGGLEVPSFAPSYRRARRRLRPEWVVDWILDPPRGEGAVSMPVVFPPGPDGAPDSSYLTGSLATPMFAEQHARLLRTLGSEAELEAFLQDAPRVAAALRDYLWSLAE